MIDSDHQPAGNLISRHDFLVLTGLSNVKYAFLYSILKIRKKVAIGSIRDIESPNPLR